MAEDQHYNLLTSHPVSGISYTYASCPSTINLPIFHLEI